MTFSIVALDPSTGQLGVAVSTARPSVGARCPYARPHLGAVATQARVNTGLAFQILDSLAAATPVDEAARAALAADEGAALRQLIAVDRLGRTFAFTGVDTVDWAGHAEGQGFACAGNMLTGPEVVPAMVDGFRAAHGDLAERLAAALASGQAAGGDKRGRQSAALFVVQDDPWGIVDLRVDDHANPVSELERLLAIWRGQWGAIAPNGTFPPADPPGR